MHIARLPHFKPRASLAAGALLFLVAGCAGTPSMPQTLASAGFHAEPANTPEAALLLSQLPVHQLVMHQENGAPEYYYADPDDCHCIYRGNAQNYAAYQQLDADHRAAFQQRSIDTLRQASTVDSL